MVESKSSPNFRGAFLWSMTRFRGMLMALRGSATTPFSSQRRCSTPLHRRRRKAVVHRAFPDPPAALCSSAPPRPRDRLRAGQIRPARRARRHLPFQGAGRGTLRDHRNGQHCGRGDGQRGRRRLRPVWHGGLVRDRQHGAGQLGGRRAGLPAAVSAQDQSEAGQKSSPGWNTTRIARSSTRLPASRPINSA